MSAHQHTLLLRGGRIVGPDHVTEDGWIRIAGGRIESLGSGTAPAAAADRIVDLRGKLVGPGFVDVHCHGDGVTRFFDDPDGVALNLARQGATTVLATLGYPDMSTNLVAQLDQFRAGLGRWGRDVVGGIHLEGPYVNRKYGAQTSRGVIKDPDAAEYRRLLECFGSEIKWWTCAPELPGALDFISAASAHHVVVGAGHTEATPEEIAAAIDAGLKVIIHWSNATGNPRAAQYRGTRCPGIDEAALVFDELSAEIIADKNGLHVHPLMARLLFKAKGPDRILIITDAGYRRPDDPPEKPGERPDVSIDGDGNLAGSRLSMAGAARNFRAFTNCSWSELFRMAALNPARLVGADREIGAVSAGRVANLIVFDDELQVTSTFVKGVEVPRPAVTNARAPVEAER